jgi:RNase P subunit RPR2
MSKYYNINKMPKDRYCSHCRHLTPHSYGKEKVEDIEDNFVKIILSIKCNTCQYIHPLIWTQEKER